MFRGGLRQIVLVLVFTGSLFSLFPVPAGAFSARATLEADRLSVGEMTRLSITVSGGRPTRPPEIQQVDGLQIRAAGTAQQFQIINGQASSTLTYNYSVLAVKPGEYTLGPYRLTTNNEETLTNTVVLTVTHSPGSSPRTGGENPPGAPEEKLAAEESLFLEISLPKTRFYLGEKIPVTISLFVGQIPVREINYPVLNQPEFLYTLTGPPAEKKTVINGLSYQVVEFPATLIPVKTGHFVLGPVELECTILTRRRTPGVFPDFFDEFFAGYERQPVTLKSNTRDLEVLPLPGGKPDDFTGGVGQFSLTVSASPQEVQAGDPVTVTLTVTGTGDLTALSPPVLSAGDGFKIYEAQKKVPPKESALEAVLFEQVLIPLSPEVNQIGPYHFSYFDPESAEYKRVATAAVPLTVKPNPHFIVSPAVTGTSPRTEPSYGRDLVFIKETPGRLRLKDEVIYRQSWFWLLQLLPVIALFSALYYRKRTALLNAETARARALRAARKSAKRLKKAQALLEKGEVELFCDELHSIVREYLGERYNQPAAGMTGDVVEQLKDQSLSEEALQNIKDFFNLYDFYRFTGKELTAAEGQKLKALADKILSA